MDDNRFDDLTRSLTPLASRRTLLGGVLASAGGWLGSLDADARKKRKTRKRKRLKPAKPNGFGCLEVNDPCRRYTQCCSGICAGKPGRKRCRAHGTGSCSQSGLGICTDPNPELLFCNGDRNCLCLRTTAGSNFCGNWNGYKACSTCRKDSDCQGFGFPVGSACVPVANGHCTTADCAASQMICLAPCGVQPPPET